MSSLHLSSILDRVLSGSAEPPSEPAPEPDTSDRFLARITCLRDSTWGDFSGRYETVLCIDGEPFAEVIWDGGPALPEWRRATGVRVKTMKEIILTLEGHARAYLDLPLHGADAVVAGLVSGAANGAAAALSFRTHLGELS